MADPKNVELARKYLPLKGERETIVALRAAGLTDTEISEALAEIRKGKSLRLLLLAAAGVGIVLLALYILIFPSLIFGERNVPVPTKSFLVEACRMEGNATVLRLYNNGGGTIEAGTGRVLDANYTEIAKVSVPAFQAGERAEANAGVMLRGLYILEYAGTIVNFAC
jgi:hypothetical protein